MKKKANFIFLLLIIIFAVSVFYAFLKFFVFRDYMIYAQTECDPSLESCFIYTCDPATEECTGDPEEDTWYYNLITKNAQNIAVCDPSAEECEELSCAPGEIGCEVAFCDEELAAEQGEGVTCSNPADFQEEETEEGAEETEMTEEEGETDGSADESEESVPEESEGSSEPGEGASSGEESPVML
ncbi:MAG: hypothetical protein A2808_03285 [Candidatus Moranbacteria bacterium RIFCSPHIGHO2_01_FULL_55_24]|nr:MAG: hypothetical protein A2808_03285 [Candidatus Moranbacteria bacterium RIFCSPHIGHO2_01_FULL_55_24]